MFIKLPPPPLDNPLADYLNKLNMVLQQSFAVVRTSRDVPVTNRVYLSSPDGTVWEITIRNTGQLDTAKHDMTERY